MNKKFYPSIISYLCKCMDTTLAYIILLYTQTQVSAYIYMYTSIGSFCELYCVFVYCILGVSYFP